MSLQEAGLSGFRAPARLNRLFFVLLIYSDVFLSLQYPLFVRARSIIFFDEHCYSRDAIGASVSQINRILLFCLFFNYSFR